MNVRTMLLIGLVAGAVTGRGEPPELAQLVAGFQKTTVAAVSDAVDQVTGQRGFMAHDLRPVTRERAKFVGPAVTTLIRPPVNAQPPSLKTTLEAIDEAAPGSVLVVVVEADRDLTGIGGLMATTCHARGLAGAVVDGAARDVDEIAALGFPVFSRSICPSTVVGRLVSVSKNQPVHCAGVAVHPQDLIVAGSDGVVVVPRARAAEILKVAQEIDERESKMVPLIREEKSILKAVEKFNRL